MLGRKVAGFIVAPRTTQLRGTTLFASRVSASVNWAAGTVHDRWRRLVEPVFVDVGDDADDRARRIVELGSEALPDRDLLINGVLILPELPRHRTVDDHDGQRRLAVAILEDPPAGKRNTEGLEVMRGDGAPLLAAVELTVAGQLSAFDAEGEVDTGNRRDSNGCRRGFDTRETFDSAEGPAASGSPPSRWWRTFRPPATCASSGRCERRSRVQRCAGRRTFERAAMRRRGG